MQDWEEEGLPLAEQEGEAGPEPPPEPEPDGPLERHFRRFYANAYGDPFRQVQDAARQFGERWVSWEGENRRLNPPAAEAVHYLGRRLAAGAGAAPAQPPRSVRPLYGLSPQDVFQDRPTLDDYRRLFAQPGRLVATYFQLQQTDVVRQLLQREGPTTVAFQRLEIGSGGDRGLSVTPESSRQTASILAGNEVTLAALQTRPNLEAIGTFHPSSFHVKAGYVENYLAFISTQNLTPTLTSNNTVETLLQFRFDSDNAAEREAARQVAFMVDRVVDAARQASWGQQVRDRFARLAEEMKQVSSKRMVLVNQQILVHYLDLMERVQANPNLHLVVSMGEIPLLLGGGGPLGDRFRKRFYTLAQQRRVTLITDRQRLNETLYTLGRQPQLQPWQKQFLNLVQQGGVIRPGATGFFYHDKTAAVFDEQGRLLSLTVGSANWTAPALIPLRSLSPEERRPILASLGFSPAELKAQQRLRAGASAEEVIRRYGRDSSLARALNAPANVEAIIHLSRGPLRIPGEAPPWQADLDRLLDTIEPQVRDVYKIRAGLDVDEPWTRASRPALRAERRLYEQGGSAQLEKLMQRLEELAQALPDKVLQVRPRLHNGQLVGVQTHIGTLPLSFTVNARGDVIVLDYDRVITGAVVANTTRLPQVLRRPGGERTTLLPGQSVTLNSLETATALVATLARALAHHERYGLVERAMDYLVANRAEANALLGELLAESIQLADPRLRQDRAYDLETVLHAISLDDRTLLGVGLGRGRPRPGKTLQRAAQLLAQGRLTGGDKPSERLYRQRLSRLQPVYRALAKLDAWTANSLDSVLTAFLDVLRRDQFSSSGGILGDLRQLLARRLLQSELARRQLHSDSRALLKAVLAPFLTVGEANYPFWQLPMRRPVYGFRSGLRPLPAPYLEYGVLDPLALQHSTDLGQPFIRLTSMTASPTHVNLGGLLGVMASPYDDPYEGAVAVYDLQLWDAVNNLGRTRWSTLTQRLREWLPQTEQVRELQELQQLLLSTGGLEQPILMVPYVANKLEQLPQRLKNLLGGRAALELNPAVYEALRQALHGDRRLNLDSLGEPEDWIRSTLPPTLPPLPYAELQKELQGQSLEAVLRARRRRALYDPSVPSDLAPTLKRVAIAAGVHSLSGDFALRNADYPSVAGYVTTTRLSFAAATAESVYGMQRYLRRLFRRQRTLVDERGLWILTEEGTLRQVASFTASGTLQLLPRAVPTLQQPAYGIQEIKLPTYGLKERGGLSIAIEVGDFEEQQGRYLLEITWLHLLRETTGMRPGYGPIKGPYQFIRGEAFQSLAARLPRFGQEERLYALYTPNLLKGFTYESGIHLLRDPQRAQVLRNLSGQEMAAALLVSLFEPSAPQAEALAAYAARDERLSRHARILRLQRHLLPQRLGKSKAGGGAWALAPLASLEGERDLSLANLQQRLLQALEEPRRAEALRAQVLRLFDRALQSGGPILPDADPLVRGAAMVSTALWLGWQYWQPQFLEPGEGRFHALNLLDARGYRTDPAVRLNITAVATMLGIRLPTEQLRQAESDAEVAALLQQHLGLAQRVIERFPVYELHVPTGPSATLVPHGSQTQVNLELQYLTGLSTALYGTFRGADADEAWTQLLELQRAYAILTASSRYTLGTRYVNFALLYGDPDSRPLTQQLAGVWNRVEAQLRQPQPKRLHLLENPTAPFLDPGEALLQQLQGEAIQTTQLILPELVLRPSGDRFRLQVNPVLPPDRPAIRSGVLLGWDVLGQVASRFPAYDAPVLSHQLELYQLLSELESSGLLQRLATAPASGLEIADVEAAQIRRLEALLEQSYVDVGQLLTTLIQERAAGNKLEVQGRSFVVTASLFLRSYEYLGGRAVAEATRTRSGSLLRALLRQARPRRLERLGVENRPERQRRLLETVKRLRSQPLHPWTPRDPVDLQPHISTHLYVHVARRLDERTAAAFRLAADYESWRQEQQARLPHPRQLAGLYDADLEQVRWEELHLLPGEVRWLQQEIRRLRENPPADVDPRQLLQARIADYFDYRLYGSQRQTTRYVQVDLDPPQYRLNDDNLPFYLKDWSLALQAVKPRLGMKRYWLQALLQPQPQSELRQLRRASPYLQRLYRLYRERLGGESPIVQIPELGFLGRPPLYREILATAVYHAEQYREHLPLLAEVLRQSYRLRSGDAVTFIYGADLVAGVGRFLGQSAAGTLVEKLDRLLQPQQMFFLTQNRDKLAELPQSASQYLHLARRYVQSKVGVLARLLEQKSLRTLDDRLRGQARLYDIPLDRGQEHLLRLYREGQQLLQSLDPQGWKEVELSPRSLDWQRHFLAGAWAALALPNRPGLAVSALQKAHTQLGHTLEPLYKLDLTPEQQAYLEKLQQSGRFVEWPQLERGAELVLSLYEGSSDPLKRADSLMPYGSPAFFQRYLDVWAGRERNRSLLLARAYRPQAQTIEESPYMAYGYDLAHIAAAGRELYQERSQQLRSWLEQYGLREQELQKVYQERVIQPALASFLETVGHTAPLPSLRLHDVLELTLGLRIYEHTPLRFAGDPSLLSPAEQEQLAQLGVRLQPEGGELQARLLSPEQYGQLQHLLQKLGLDLSLWVRPLGTSGWYEAGSLRIQAELEPEQLQQLQNRFGEANLERLTQAIDQLRQAYDVYEKRIEEQLDVFVREHPQPQRPETLWEYLMRYTGTADRKAAVWKQLAREFPQLGRLLNIRFDDETYANALDSTYWAQRLLAEDHYRLGLTRRDADRPIWYAVMEQTETVGKPSPFANNYLSRLETLKKAWQRSGREEEARRLSADYVVGRDEPALLLGTRSLRAIYTLTQQAGRAELWQTLQQQQEQLAVVGEAVAAQVRQEQLQLLPELEALSSQADTGSWEKARLEEVVAQLKALASPARRDLDDGLYGRQDLEGLDLSDELVRLVSRGKTVSRLYRHGPSRFRLVLSEEERSALEAQLPFDQLLQIAERRLERGEELKGSDLDLLEAKLLEELSGLRVPLRDRRALEQAEERLDLGYIWPIRSGPPLSAPRLASLLKPLSLEDYERRVAESGSLLQLSAAHLETALVLPGLSPLYQHLGDFDGDMITALAASSGHLARTLIEQLQLGEELQESQVEQYQQLLQHLHSLHQRYDETLHRLKRVTATYLGLSYHRVADLEAGQVAALLEQVHGQYPGLEKGRSLLPKYQQAAQTALQLLQPLAQAHPEGRLADLAGSGEAWAQVLDLVQALQLETLPLAQLVEQLQQPERLAQLVQAEAAQETAVGLMARAAGALVPQSTFETLQGLIGSAATHLIGSGYNALIGLQSQAMFGLALHGVLSADEDAPQAVLEAQDLLNRYGLTLPGLGEEVRLGADLIEQRLERLSGLLAGLNQMFRDAIKPKSGRQDEFARVMARIHQSVENAAAALGPDARPSDVEQARAQALLEELASPDIATVVDDESGLTAVRAVVLLTQYLRADSSEAIEKLVDPAYRAAQERLQQQGDLEAAARLNQPERLMEAYLAESLLQSYLGFIQSRARPEDQQPGGLFDKAAYLAEGNELYRRLGVLTPEDIAWLRSFAQGQQSVRSQDPWYAEVHTRALQVHGALSAALVSELSRGHLLRGEQVWGLAAAIFQVAESLKEQLTPRRWQMQPDTPLDEAHFARESYLRALGLGRLFRLSPEQEEQLYSTLARADVTQALGRAFLSGALSHHLAGELVQAQSDGDAARVEALINRLNNLSASAMLHSPGPQYDPRSLAHANLDEILRRLRKQQEEAVLSETTTRYVSPLYDTLSLLSGPLLVAALSQGLPKEERTATFLVDIAQSLPYLSADAYAQTQATQARLAYTLRQQDNLFHGLSQVFLSEVTLRALNRGLVETLDAVLPASASPHRQGLLGLAAESVGTALALSASRAVSTAIVDEDWEWGLALDAMTQAIRETTAYIWKIAEDYVTLLLRGELEILDHEENLALDYTPELLNPYEVDAMLGLHILDAENYEVITDDAEAEYE